MVPRSIGTRYAYQSLWGSVVPDEFVNESQPVILATRIKLHAAGRIVGCRYYRHKSSIGGNVGFLKPSLGADQIYATTVFHHRNADEGPDEGEWQHAYFPRPYFRVEAEDQVFVSVAFRQGLYYASRFVFDGTNLINGDIEGMQDGDGGVNGAYTYDADWNAYQTYNSSHYGIDILFLADHTVNPN